ncbi:MAG: ABC transporter ATP-binding protein, partial [Oscillospiraceae bacterium]|nr:ABC transporter ATP-binding protein [Oscillospiraceae bacterium]
METFEISGLSFSYPGQSQKALDDLSLTVGQGEFTVICGPSGCGKSTLLRMLKTVLAPHGVRMGEILFEGRPLDTLDQREQSQRIGFVQQSPENQIVTDKVWHELAFGLESLSLDTPAIRRRVAEMASFFGIETWFYKNVTDLSGGQKQLLNLASVMVMQPSVLILDEPTSQLDPIAASEFLSVLKKINRELGTTVLLTEHRLEEALSIAGQTAVMDCGRIIFKGTASDAGLYLKKENSSIFLSMPTAMRVWAAVDGGDECPVTVRQGRAWLEGYLETHERQALPPEPMYAHSDETAIACDGVWFRYEKDLPDVVKGLDLEVKKGE